VQSLDWYDTGRLYPDLDHDGALPDGDAVSVDMAGDAGVLATCTPSWAIRLKHSMQVGMSHHDAAPAEVVGGPTPGSSSHRRRCRGGWSNGAHTRSNQRRVRAPMPLAAFVDGSTKWLTIERS
jgi:hypothetical protein